MFKVGERITDKYNRSFIVVEKQEKEAENGKKYKLYNLYPTTERPKKAIEPANSLGFKYEPYLYLTEDVLKNIKTQ